MVFFRFRKNLGQEIQSVGRPSVISTSGINKLKKQVEKASMELQALSKAQIFEAASKIIHLEQGGSSETFFLNDNIMCPKTFRKILKESQFVERKADIKSTSRQQQHHDMRNSLSLCALIETAFECVQPSLFFSSDDVSLLLNEFDKPKVMTTKECCDLLEQHNTGVSVTENLQKQRTITMSFTIDVENLVCTVIKIKDNKFTDLNKQPRIFQIETGLFVMLCHPDVSNDFINQCQYRWCIIPTVIKRREDIITKINQHDSIIDLKFTPDSPQPNNNSINTNNNVVFNTEIDKENKEKYRFICLACDGAGPQINVIEDNLIQKNKKYNWDILFIKYSAGCSMSQSPNDVGKMHNILKQQFKSPTFKYSVESPDPLSPVWEELRVYLLKHLEGASYKTYWQCLKHTQEFINRAFTISTIKSAYRKSGIYPYSSQQILSANSHYSTLSNEDAIFVKSILPELTACMRINGSISEEKFTQLLVTRPAVNNTQSRAGMPLNNMVTNRQRAVIINSEIFMQINQERLKRKRQPEINQRSSKKQQLPNLTTALSHRINKSKYCSNTICHNEITKENKSQFSKCRGLYCRVTCCRSSTCSLFLNGHEDICEKVESYIEPEVDKEEKEINA